MASKSIAATIEWSSLMIILSGFACIFYCLSIHPYEASEFPLLFYTFIFGAIITGIETLYGLFTIIIVIIYANKQNFKNEEALVFKWTGFGYKLLDLFMQITQNAMFIYFAIIYDPFGRGDDETNYEIMILVYSAVKSIIAFIAINQFQNYAIENSSLSRALYMILPISPHTTLEESQIQLYQLKQIHFF